MEATITIDRMSTQTEWKSKPPTEKQIAFAKRLGIKDVPKTSGEMSDLINKAKGTQGNNLDRVTLSLPAEELHSIEAVFGPITDKLLAVLVTVRGRCIKTGVTEAPAIGMIFNQVCAQRRLDSEKDLTQ